MFAHGTFSTIGYLSKATILPSEQLGKFFSRHSFHVVFRANFLSYLSMIRKRTDGYHVLSEKGKNLGGPYKTKEAAEKRLRQVEYFKHKG
jgi:hypothetical protein